MTPCISQYPKSFTDGSSTVIHTDPLCHTFVSSTAITVNRQSSDFSQLTCPADLPKKDANQLNMNTGTECGGSLGACYMFLSVNSPLNATQPNFFSPQKDILPLAVHVKNVSKTG